MRNYLEDTQEIKIKEVNSKKYDRKSLLIGGLVSLIILLLAVGALAGFGFWLNNKHPLDEADKGTLFTDFDFYQPKSANEEVTDLSHSHDEVNEEENEENEEGETVCPVCDGEGVVECATCAGTGRNDCATCEGGTITEIIHEEVHEDDDPGDGVFFDGGADAVVYDCPDCDGHGYFDCGDCAGHGQVECAECGGDGAV